MTDAKRTFRQALVLSLAPILLTNVAQWANTRARAAERDELLLAAFNSSVTALDSARAVLEDAQRKLAKCSEKSSVRSGAPAAQGGTRSEMAPPGEVLFMEQTETAPQFSLARGLLAPSQATIVLDVIASRQAAIAQDPERHGVRTSAPAKGAVK